MRGTINGEPSGRPQAGLPWSTASVAIFAILVIGAVVIFGEGSQQGQFLALLASTIPSLVAAFKSERAAQSTEALANGFGDRKFQAAVRKVLDEREITGSSDRAQTGIEDDAELRRIRDS